MSETARSIDRGWLKSRLSRHLPEMLRLSVPAMTSRIGVMLLAFVDTMMVGRYSSLELAYLGAANGTVVVLILVVAMGLLMGVMISTANAYGRGDWAECGRVWRRNLTYSAAIGGLALVLCLPGELWLTLLNQPDDVAREGGRLIWILALGVPAHLIYLNCAFFLEGVKRPQVAVVVMLSANVLNAVLNYMLIYGAWGAPEMGAEGSAWTSTVVRWGFALAGVAYIWFAPSLRRYQVRRPHGQRWAQWRGQRVLGYASAISLGVEVGAFAALNVFAGWLGTGPLAAWQIVINIMSVIFMLAAGIGAASSVRVGIAHARADHADTALAGWLGLALCTVCMLTFGAVMNIMPGALFAIYNDDPALMVLAIPAIALAGLAMVFDGGQTVVSSALRGLGETWWPTAIQALAYIVFMIPLGYLLAVVFGRGTNGLVEAVILASIVSVGLQAWRFQWLTAPR